VFPGLGLFYSGRPAAALVFVSAGPAWMAAFMSLGALFAQHLFPIVMLAVSGWVLMWALQIGWAVFAARAAIAFRPRWFNSVAGYVLFVVASYAVSGLINLPTRRWVIEPFWIPTSSMTPTLLPGDQVLVLKVGPAARWGPGDVIAYPSVPLGGGAPVVFMKRVLAVGPATVEQEGRALLVDGLSFSLSPCEPPQYSYVDDASGTPGRARAAWCFVETPPRGGAHQVIYDLETPRPREFGPTRIEADQVFVVGDNRDNSTDSRYQGAVLPKDVIGRAAIVWFSFTWADGFRWERFGKRL
jgi:signal peptidase I